MSIDQKELIDSIAWRKQEINLNGWNILDLCIKDLMIETGVKDTIEDMLIATFGSIIVVLLYLFNKTQNILYKIVRNV